MVIGLVLLAFAVLFVLCGLAGAPYSSDAVPLFIITVAAIAMGIGQVLLLTSLGGQ